MATVVDKVYLDLAKEVLSNGYTYLDEKRGVTCTEISSALIKIPIQNQFPLISAKNVHFPSVVEELRWFLSGSENIADLKCGIWDKDAYNLYLRKLAENAPHMTPVKIEDFVKLKGKAAPHVLGTAPYLLGDTNYTHYGQVGRIYGAKWKEGNQLINVLNSLKEQPMGRRHVVDAWSVDNSNVALPCCFSGDMLVRAKEDYKKISDLKVGDEVLTVDSSFQKITDTSKVPYKGIMKELKIFGNTKKILCTPKHPFLVKEKGFIESKDVKNGDYVAIPVNKKEEIPLFEEKIHIGKNRFKTKTLDFKKLDYWYLMGYFLGDGWLIDSKNEILFSVADKDIDEIYDRFKSVLSVSKIKNNRSKCITFSGKNQTLFNVLAMFGKYAHGKTIPEFILDAPKEYIEEFLKGYQKADGCVTADGIVFTTVSDNIAYSLQLLYAKLGVKASIYYQNRPKTTVIQGRDVNQRNTYSINVYKSIKKSKNYIVDNDYLWMKVVNIEDIDFDGFVYNLSVENNHTYNVFNIVNHNCHYGFQIILRPLSLEERLLLSKANIDIAYAQKSDWNNFLDKTNVPKYAFTLKWNQRSTDLYLGLPFNIASYALLANIIGNLVNMMPEYIEGNLSHIHIYENALEACKNLPLNDIILDYPEVEIADYMVYLTIESIHSFFADLGDLGAKPFAKLVPGTYNPVTNAKVNMLAEKIVKP